MSTEKDFRKYSVRILVLALASLTGCASVSEKVITISQLRGSDDAPSLFRYELGETTLCVYDIKERIGCTSSSVENFDQFKKAVEETAIIESEHRASGFLDSDEIWVEFNEISIECNLGSCPAPIENALGALGKQIAASKLDLRPGFSEN